MDYRKKRNKGGGNRERLQAIASFHPVVELNSFYGPAIQIHPTTKSPKATRRAVVTTTNHSLFQIWISFRLSAYVYSVVLPAAGFDGLLSNGQEISLMHRTDFIPELLWIHLCRMACSFRYTRVFFRGLSRDRFPPSSILIIHDEI